MKKGDLKWFIICWFLQVGLLFILLSFYQSFAFTFNESSIEYNLLFLAFLLIILVMSVSLMFAMINLLERKENENPNHIEEASK